MSQFQVFPDNTPLPDIEFLTGDAGGAVGPDGAFNIDLLGGVGLTMTGVPASNQLTMEVDAQENIIYVAKHGNDANSGLNIENAKLTIQSAVTAADAGDTILVSPGTYTETITHAANDVTLIAHGKPNTCIITQADANVINFGAYTGIQYKNFRISVTAATSAIWTIQGTTGQCVLKECQISMTSAADIAAVNQPGVGRVTGAGTLTVIFGRVFYYHTGDGGGTAQKAAFSVANGGLVQLQLIEEIDIANTGTSLVSSIGIDLATTGNFQIHDCIIFIDDTTATNIAGLAYIGGTGVDHEYFRNTIHITGNGNCYGFFSDDTATSSRFFYNHIHITANTAYSFHVGNTSTVVSQFDDIIAANGVNIVGTGNFTCASSLIDGDFTCRSLRPADVEQINIMNTDNTATAGDAALNISVGGTTSTGDPYVQWLITGSTAFSAGIDNSDTDAFKIGPNVDPSTGTSSFEIAAATGAITFSEAYTFPVADGGAGEVLTTDGGGAVSWQAAGGMENLGPAGDGLITLARPQICYNDSSNTQVDAVTTADRIYAHCITSNGAITVAQLGVYVSTAQVNAQLRVGLYDDNDGLPGTRFFESGILDASAIGFKWVAGAVDIPHGVIWILYVVDVANIALRRTGISRNTIGHSVATGSPAYNVIFDPTAFGVLPANYTLGGTASVSSALEPPTIFYLMT